MRGALKVTTALRVVFSLFVTGCAAAVAQGTCSWLPLGSGLSGSSVRPMAVHDDGTGVALYVGGNFVTAGGGVASNIARWDGSAWSPLGGGVNSTVTALAVHDDGSGRALYAGGFFTTAGGVAANHIARWDGTSWSSLQPGGGFSPSGPNALVVFDDGSGPALYAGGSFTTVGGVSVNHIAKWDGSTWSPLGSGVNAAVTALAVYDDGTGPALYAGGQFSDAGGFAANRIAKWDGTTWSPLANGVGGAVGYADVSTLTVFDDGTGPGLYAGGWFNLASGVSADGIARWDGSYWSSAGGGVGVPGSYSDVKTLAVFDDGTGPALFAGGTFTLSSGVPTNLLARWDGNGWSTVGSGVSGGYLFVNGLIVFDDGTGPALHVGGWFTITGGVPASHIARWNCGARISLSATQAFPGAPVFVNNANLTPGREYYNLFSLDPCPGGPGTGPATFFGGCVATAANLQFITSQILAPVGTGPFHLIAQSSYGSFGPFNVPPIIVEGICLDVTGGVLGAASPVVRIVVQ